MPSSADSFDITVLNAPRVATRCVLFAAGRGGNPLRHLGLLQALAAEGMTVVAPHFEMLASPIPTKAELLERTRRLSQALDRHGPPGLPVAGMGHSVGAVTLLLLAGATADTFAGDQVKADVTSAAMDRLVLLAPPTDFFRRPGALAAVKLPIQVWAGSRDTITPPAQAEFLRDVVEATSPVELRVAEGAGHFSFMNELPPHITDTHPDRAAFLQSLGVDACHFLAA